MFLVFVIQHLRILVEIGYNFLHRSAMFLQAHVQRAERPGSVLSTTLCCALTPVCSPSDFYLQMVEWLR